MLPLRGFSNNLKVAHPREILYYENIGLLAGYRWSFLKRWLGNCAEITLNYFMGVKKRENV